MKMSRQTKTGAAGKTNSIYFGFFFTEVHLKIQSNIVVIVENLKEA